MTLYEVHFKYNLRLHTLNPSCLPVCPQHYLESPHSKAPFSEYKPVGGAEFKRELETREISPPGIVSSHINKKLLSGERQRKKWLGPLWVGTKTFLLCTQGT
jgi:hypothetical protein